MDDSAELSCKKASPLTVSVGSILKNERGVIYLLSSVCVQGVSTFLTTRWRYSVNVCLGEPLMSDIKRSQYKQQPVNPQIRIDYLNHFSSCTWRPVWPMKPLIMSSLRGKWVPVLLWLLWTVRGKSKNTSSFSVTLRLVARVWPGFLPRIYFNFYIILLTPVRFLLSLSVCVCVRWSCDFHLSDRAS